MHAIVVASNFSLPRRYCTDRHRDQRYLWPKVHFFPLHVLDRQYMPFNSDPLLVMSQLTDAIVLSIWNGCIIFRNEDVSTLSDEWVDHVGNSSYILFQCRRMT